MSHPNFQRKARTHWSEGSERNKLSNTPSSAHMFRRSFHCRIHQSFTKAAVFCRFATNMSEHVSLDRGQRNTFLMRSAFVLKMSILWTPNRTANNHCMCPNIITVKYSSNDTLNGKISLALVNFSQPLDQLSAICCFHSPYQASLIIAWQLPTQSLITSLFYFYFSRSGWDISVLSSFIGAFATKPSRFF